ncbi:MAG: O-antigen ligase family protein, partial [Acidimicrobiales bacterium]
MGPERPAFARPARPAPAAVATGWLAARPRPLLLGVAVGVLALAAGSLAPVHLPDAVALVAAAALVAAVLLRPMVGVLLLVGLVPVTSGLATGFPVPHVRLSEAVIGLVGVTLMASVRRRDAVPWQALDWALLAYGLCWLAFAVVADRSLGEHLGITQWGTVLGQLQFLVVYRAVRVGVRTPSERRLAVGTLVLASAAAAVLGLLQEVRAPGVARFVTTITGGIATGSVAGATSHASRATGPFDNWAALAGYLLPIVLVLVACGFARIPVRHRRLFVAAGVLALAALFVTDEQSAILCLLVGVVVLARQYGATRHLGRWVAAVAVVVAAVAGPLLVTRLGRELSASAGTGRVAWVPQTVSFRWTVWVHQYLPAIGARPLSGYGVVLPSSVHWPFPESQYVSFLMEGGLPMLAAFAVLAWAMLDGARRASRSADPLTVALGRALTVAVVSMLVMDAMWPFLSNGGMPQVLWALMALAVPGAVPEGAVLAAPSRASRAAPVG